MPDALDPDVTFVNAARPANGGATGGRLAAPQIRLADHAYPDGGETLAGQDRPNPRLISNTVFNQLDANGATINMPNSGGFSSLLWVWGQFLDHDLDQTRNTASAGSAPVIVPAGDPAFTPGSPLLFTRSAFLEGTGTSAANPRVIRNEVTSFIDASNIYGSNDAKLDALLVPGTAKLRLTAAETIGFVTETSPVFGNGPITGDTRASENIALLSMHALFAREHNRLVDALDALDPTLTTDELFEAARARVEAVVQAITYNEFLPILIGEDALDDYDGFKSDVNPAISLEFSTAIYRFGHTLLSPTIARMNEDGATHVRGDIALRDVFNARNVVEQTGIEAIFRGMSTTMSQEFDTFMVEDVRSLLFGGGAPGQDLAVLNIQRGRDHGLPSYNEMREALGLAPKTSFGQISSDAAIVARLTAAYGGEVSKLDLWVGGLAEDSVGGGIMGETFRAVMIDQFTRLRDGDAFWSENRGFGDDELEALWSTTLSEVIQRNSDVEDLQTSAFLAYARRGGDDGADTIVGGTGRNLILGQGGADSLTGGGVEDHILGGSGADTIDGGLGVDFVDAGIGDDVIVIRGAQALADTIIGGAGADTLRVDGASGNVRLNGTAAISGIETFTGGGRAVLANGEANDLDFSIFASVTGASSIQGLGGNDRIIGSSGVQALLGGDGDDTLDGRGGTDTLRGANGDDLLLFRGAEGQTDTFDGGAGIDTIRIVAANGDATLTGTQRVTGVEIFDGAGRALRGSSAADILDLSQFQTVTALVSLQGLSGNDTMTGGGGGDRMFGDMGNDTIEGRAGDDTLTGGASNDTFRFVAGALLGDDRVTDFDASGNDLIRLVGFSFGASNPANLTNQQRFAALIAATDFGGGGATIDFDEIGGDGSLRVDNVTTATLNFTTADFAFS